MVKIEQLNTLEVGEDFELENEDEYTDVSGSEYDDSEFDEGDDVEDDEDDQEYEDESLLERIVALKDIIPLRQRNLISHCADTLVNTGKSGFRLMGGLAWVISTSALVILVPLALEMEKDQALAQYDTEARLTQSGPQQALEPGLYPPGAPIHGLPGSPQPQQGSAMTPPGF
ncbi:mitochondrial import receptor subunit Tom22 [Dimargaris cristalligena]|uniref:Mitochondrial outer membrane translocase complex, subunit Tom22 n=1 Tax=Dimargaris cristalligena TaxID=215637 RepID=A0A4P9ZYI2_9FUNG|nr:mitochondrial import receptor subunit Tom22 [Dimargaris cristalligena]RKP38776.1 mitochondrial outer membrane translocase complex, subunit Tom22 [Dimargaris cristalligena]|eukprot:RKP38776.1 mitochondrial outer membrane translocase complex, subunit Tom22 [Dimargaris cristalligena]